MRLPFSLARLHWILVTIAFLVATHIPKCSAQAVDVDDSTVFAIFVNVFESVQKEVVKRSTEIDARGNNVGKDLKSAAVNRFGFRDESDYDIGSIVLADIKTRIKNL